MIVQQDPDFWSLPKGHIKKGEGEIEAARREVEEETGIKELILVKRLGKYRRFELNENGTDNKRILKEIVVFLFKTTQEELNPKVSDSMSAEWVSREELIKKISHPKDKEFIKKVLD